MTFVSWTTNDDHAGGLVGISIGLAFIIIGFVYVFLKEIEEQSVPLHRILLGGVLLALGFLGLITGIVFIV